jgi:phage tail sheath gpL-like
VIGFNTIPINILTPGQFVEFDSRAAQQGLPTIPHKILVIAPRLTSGSIAAMTVARVRSAAEAEQFCGRGSVGAAMLKAVRAANPYTDCWMIGVSDAGGAVAATGTVTIVGPATAAGALRLYVAGEVVSIAVANGDAQNVIATALAAAINANSALPVTANAATNVVTVTARHAGTVGNEVDLRLNYNQGDVTPAGLAVTIVAMANGATNPDMTAITAALGDSQYHTMITPFTDNTSLTVLETFLNARWSGTVNKEGQAFGALGGSYAAIDTVAVARNSPFSTLIGCQKSPTPSYVIASVVGALDASQAEDPSNCNRPRQTMLMTGVLPPKESDRYSRTERNVHLSDGASTYIVDDGGNCRIERLVTTYKTTNGVPDTSYQNIEDMRALAYLRYSTIQRIAIRFPRYKLANDGTPIAPGQLIVTPKVIRNELIALFIDWQKAGLVEGLEQFKTDLIVERNATDKSRVDAIIPPDLINGFRVFAGQVQFRQ